MLRRQRSTPKAGRLWAIGLTGLALTLGAGGLTLRSLAATQTKPAPLDISRCRAAFYDDFRALDVSSVGTGTRWIAHTPWFGDFGEAQFTDPQPGFPFTTGPDGLTITAEKDETGKWRSGLLSSTDPQSQGYAAKYGYFELKATFPKGKGTWPAFWLLTANRKADPDIEIDIIEYYGHWTDRYQAVVTVRPKGGRPSRSEHTWINVEPDSLVAGPHAYGVAVGRKDIVFYLDRREVWRTPTPPEHTQPLGVLFNLALGSGWPIGETPNPSQMNVSSVAHYADLTQCGVNPRAAGDS